MRRLVESTPAAITRARLEQYGVDGGQGYHLGPPTPLAAGLLLPAR
jgi:EAL domain-containing protein (putative c-di-GMP-specific phosphodiesterase class I)